MLRPVLAGCLEELACPIKEPCLSGKSGSSVMVKTEVINDTTGELSLKEGNAGVYRDIKKLQKGDKHVIEIDPNATYREYVVVSTPSGDKVFVTSDDCIDNSTITIYVDKDGVYKFNGKARADTSTSAEVTATSGVFSKILRKIFPRQSN